jgi:DNA-directed RNA polymerase sigma subunit (sigma70/sigma32)
MSTRTRSVVETIEDEETGAEQTLINQEMRKILLDSMKLLSPREEKILRLRFGLYTAEDDVENFPMTITQLLELQAEEN